MARTVTHRYLDPLSELWLATAARLGLSVRRVRDAYASTDGAGHLDIARDEELDADDSLAQMIFHEICHSLVEGEDAFARPDWGIDNTGTDHEWREHACLRAQFVLAGRHGLRAALAPTTDFRALWDQLGEDVLADRADLSVQAAIVALGRAARPPWAPALDEALSATARIGAELAALWPRLSPRELARHRGDAAPSLWSELAPPPPAHPTGLPTGAARPEARCGGCAWRYQARGASRCRQAGARRIDDAWPACERYEPEVACQDCGACCRAAYHSVEVARRDPVVKRHPELIVERGAFLELARRGDRCAALTGGDARVTAEGRRMLPMACEIYEDRPRTCRDFTAGSEHCLTARRRVGLSL